MIERLAIFATGLLVGFLLFAPIWQDDEPEWCFVPSEGKP